VREPGIQYPADRERRNYALHTADMVGVRVGGDEEIDPGDPEPVEIAHYPVAHIRLAGIDQDGFVIEDKQGGVPLADIKEICREVPVVVCEMVSPE
jgi:hypothetical protein